VKNLDIYKCPDEGPIGTNGNPGLDKTGAGSPGYPAAGFPISPSTTYSQAYGHSYKFTKESYSLAPLVAGQPATTPYDTYGGSVLKAGDFNEVITPTGAKDAGGNPTFTLSGTPQPPVCPLTLSYYNQPAMTVLFHCQNPGWQGLTAPAGQTIWHQQGENFGFADGHSKFQATVDKPTKPTNPYQTDRFCDGATGPPPIGTTEPCNTAGVSRVSP
jgi:prepilin-type processing-associated H-X9-DG protein